jgi:hypothetical protein
VWSAPCNTGSGSPAAALLLHLRGWRIDGNVVIAVPAKVTLHQEAGRSQSKLLPTRNGVPACWVGCARLKTGSCGFTGVQRIIVFHSWLNTQLLLNVAPANIMAGQLHS